MLRQIVEITLMNLRNVASRLAASSVIVVGIAGVVGVLVALLSMAIGFRTALESTGRPDRAVVLRGGSNGELSSGIGTDAAAIVASMEGVAETSAELFTIADVPKRSSGSPANLVVRGVQASAFSIRPELRIVEGRTFATGKRELIAGRGASKEFAGIDLGAHVAFRDSDWTIVGIFESGGTSSESELWTDLPVAQTAFRRAGSISTMRLRLTSTDAAAPLAARIAGDPRLDLQLKTEPEYYATQAEDLTTLITRFGYLVATIMAIGAVFAALNTMYSAVSARTVEIATLRALGFGGTPVVASVMVEALLLGLAGGALGALFSYLVYNGATTSTLGGGFTQVAFAFHVTPQLVAKGVIWSISLGAVGGLLPAIRAARMPITPALRGE